MESSLELTTILHSNEVHFKWTIENWNLSPIVRPELKSQDFLLKKIDKVCFLTISVVTNTRGTSYNYLNVHMDACDQLTRCAIDVYVLNNENAKVKLSLNQTKHTKDKLCFEYLNQEYVVGNNMIFHCDIKYATESHLVENIVENFDSVDEVYKKKCTLRGYDQFYTNQELCDVTIKIGKKLMKAHTIILATASTYFKAMFKHNDMKENTERLVDLSEDNDVTFENFSYVLDYLYGCKNVYELRDAAYELLILADKYGIDLLQKSCELYLGDVINDDNVTKTLLFADKYNCDILKRRALAFAKTNIEAVKKSSEFEELCKNQKLMLEIL